MQLLMQKNCKASMIAKILSFRCKLKQIWEILTILVSSKSNTKAITMFFHKERLITWLLSTISRRDLTPLMRITQWRMHIPSTLKRSNQQNAGFCNLLSKINLRNRSLDLSVKFPKRSRLNCCKHKRESMASYQSRRSKLHMRIWNSLMSVMAYPWIEQIDFSNLSKRHKTNIKPVTRPSF